MPSGLYPCCFNPAPRILLLPGRLLDPFEHGWRAWTCLKIRAPEFTFRGDFDNIAYPVFYVLVIVSIRAPDITFRGVILCLVCSSALSHEPCSIRAPRGITSGAMGRVQIFQCTSRQCFNPRSGSISERPREVSPRQDGFQSALRVEDRGDVGGLRMHQRYRVSIRAPNQFRGDYNLRLRIARRSMFQSALRYEFRGDSDQGLTGPTTPEFNPSLETTPG